MAANHFAFLLDVGQGEFEDLAGEPTDNETVGAGSDGRDLVSALQTGLLPLLNVINRVSLGHLLNMERVLFAALLLLLLFQGHHTALTGVLSVLPVVNNILTCHNNVGLGHGDVLRLNANRLGLERATYRIAKHDIPSVLNFFHLGNQDAVLAARFDLLETVHILNVLFVDTGIPENNAHIAALWLAESKHKSGAEVAPHIVRLDIGEQNVSVHCKSHSQPEAFPGNAVHDTRVAWHAEGPQVNALSIVKLYSALVAFRAVDQGTSDSQDVAIGAPFAGLDKHAGVDELGTVIGEVLHELHATALVNDGQLGGILVHVFIAEALTV